MNNEVAIKISSKYFMVDIHNIVGENMEVIKYYIYISITVSKYLWKPSKER